MKKQITIVLEVESDDEFMMNDEFIKTDLMAEINCTSNSYDLISIDIEKTQLKTQGEADEKPMIEHLTKKEIRNQIEYIKEFLEENNEDWYVYSTLRDEIRQLEIILEREGII